VAGPEAKAASRFVATEWKNGTATAALTEGASDADVKTIVLAP